MILKYKYIVINIIQKIFNLIYYFIYKINLYISLKYKTLYLLYLY